MENIIHDDTDIEDYYKNIDKPIINNCINNLNLKNLLKLSTVVDLYLFTKKKNKKMSRKINMYPETLNKMVEPCELKQNCKDIILSDKNIVMNTLVSGVTTKDTNQKMDGGSVQETSVQNGEIQQIIGSNRFNKEKNNNQQIDQFTWKLKDKRELLKECEFKRKKIIKEASSSLNILSKADKSSKLVNEIKIKNNNLLNNVENIDSIIETIENNFPTMVDEFIEIYSN